MSTTNKALKREFINELKIFRDDRDYILGLLNIANTDEDRNTILNFIAKAREVGDELKSDEILQLAMALQRRRIQ